MRVSAQRASTVASPCFHWTADLGSVSDSYSILFPFLSFMATNNQQTSVNLTRKFNSWEYSWHAALEQRMPWFDAKGTHTNYALLTTSSSPTYYPAGSIIWAGTDRHPAYWIYNKMQDPGVIWYWVNEDDCDEDRKPGQYSFAFAFTFRYNTIHTDYMQYTTLHYIKLYYNTLNYMT